MTTDDASGSRESMEYADIRGEETEGVRNPETASDLTALSDSKELNSTTQSEQACWPITLIFANLRADSKAIVTVHPDEFALWGSGDARDGLVGWSLESSRDPVLNLRSFVINTHELFLQTDEACEEIRVRLYVHTVEAAVRGRIDLPPGASVTLESAIDRTSVIGLSSFFLQLR